MSWSAVLQHRDEQLKAKYDPCAYCGKHAIPKTKWRAGEKLARGYHPSLGTYLTCQSCGRDSIKPNTQ